MHRRWTVRECDPGAVAELSRDLGLAPLVAAVLVSRGYATPPDAEAFLHPTLSSLPDPNLLPGVGAAVERLLRAAETGERAWVYTDYDVDGVTSAALLCQFLGESGIPFQVHLPRRDREGYGLHGDVLREISSQGATLVITADCGVTAVSETALARDLGIDLVITDHHTPGPELPDASAVVNPKLPGGGYPDTMLAGVGVAWNLVAALRRGLRDRGHYGNGKQPDLRNLLDLVALGTVADVAPLRGVNRVLVAHGLLRLNRSPRPGIAALREVSGVNGAIRAGHIGFQLGPRLNAAGRMEGPHEALALLSTKDRQQAHALARTLDGLNRRRQSEERAILALATQRVAEEEWWPQRWSLVLESDGWHRGVIGIVASRLVERFHRPTVVLSVEGSEAKGSARSIPGLHLCEALSACAGLLRSFGGHAAAAGLQLPAKRIGEFRERFEQAVRRRIDEEALTPELQLDGEAAFSDLDLGAVRDLARVEPFGFGNPTPQFLSRRVAVLDVRAIGKDREHLKFRLEQDGRRLDAVAWRKAEGLSHVAPGALVDVAHTPQINLWNGQENVQLVVEGMRPS